MLTCPTFHGQSEWSGCGRKQGQNDNRTNESRTSGRDIDDGFPGQCRETSLDKIPLTRVGAWGIEEEEDKDVSKNNKQKQRIVWGGSSEY